MRQRTAPRKRGQGKEGLLRAAFRLLMEQAMRTVGEQLRARREAMGLGLQDLAAVTKIRADLLRALEEGRYEVFRAPVYVKGSARSYALALKLDPAPLLRQLEAELARNARLAQSPSLTSEEPTWIDKLLFHIARLSWGHALVVLGVLFLLGVWVGRYAWVDPTRINRALQGFSPSLYEVSVPAALETLPLPEPSPGRT